MAASAANAALTYGALGDNRALGLATGIAVDIGLCVDRHHPDPGEDATQGVAAVVLQTHQPAAIVVEYDHEHTGAAATKNRGLARVTSEWVAFVDDDDPFMPEHLEKLREAQLDSGADVVYSMPYIPQLAAQGGIDPSGTRGAPFDPDELRRRSYIQTTSLVRTKLAQSVGGFQLPQHVQSDYDDWGFWLACLDAGATFHHLPEQTFLWEHHGRNTSGRPDRW